MTSRVFPGPEDLAGLVRAAFGAGRRLDTVTRLPGGTSKGVYRLGLDDGTSVVLYLWSPAENYWPAPVPGQVGAGTGPDPFTEANGLEPFLSASARLGRLGVRTPEVLLVDRSGAYWPADLALVEDVRGGTLAAYLNRDPAGAASTLVQLGRDLAAMREIADWHTERLLDLVGHGPGSMDQPKR